MNKGIFAIFFVVAVLSISFPVNAQKTAQRVGEGYTSEGIYYEVYVAEDLAQDVFVRLLDYKQMLRPDTVKYFLFTIARNIVIDYIRRYYKKQEIDSYIYDTMSTSTNETEEKIIGDDLVTMERTRLAAMPEQRRLIYTLNRFENKTSPEIANELNLSCRTVENHLFLGRREMREFFRNCI